MQYGEGRSHQATSGVMRHHSTYFRQDFHEDRAFQDLASIGIIFLSLR
jgi:hypothetical protein